MKQDLANDLKSSPTPSTHEAISNGSPASELGSETGAWLSYLAPEGLPFGLALDNAKITLEPEPATTQASAPQNSLLRASRPSLAEEFQISPSSVPFDIFAGINLTKVTSPNQEGFGAQESDFPQNAFFDFSSESSSRVPEPSSTLLVFLGLGGTLLD